ncbi:hypothetical protein UMZ34_20465 [Halopseudomonas pachastrellae]|nr:hypothetical protein UMZ34_20465 [Halopseudomonas pachastrellae]
MPEGSILCSFIYAQREPEVVKALRDRRITCFAMELIPRITAPRQWTRCPPRQPWPATTPRCWQLPT